MKRKALDVKGRIARFVCACGSKRALDEYKPGEYYYQLGFLHVIDKFSRIHLVEPSVEAVSQVLRIRLATNTLDKF